MNAWPSHDTLTPQNPPPPPSFQLDPQTLDPSQMFATQPFQNQQFQHQPHHQQLPPQLQQHHQQQQLQHPRAPTPQQQSFPYQVNPVVPSKRPRPGDDSIAASPRQHPNAPNLSRSQTPQQPAFPPNPQASQGPPTHQQPPQSNAPGALQAPTPYHHLQHGGSANATPSPTMSNQQYRPPQPQSRMQTLSPNPTFPSQAQHQQQPQQAVGMSPTPDPNARVNTPQTAQFPNNGQQMGPQMAGQVGGMNFGMQNLQNTSTSQFNPNFGVNPNANPGMNGQFPAQVTLPPGLAQQQAETQRLYQMKQQQLQQQMIATNMSLAQQQARAAQANGMNAMMNPMAQNPNISMANRPPGSQGPPGMNAAQQQQLAIQNHNFMQRLQTFYASRNMSLDPNPTVAGRPVSLFQLFQLIQRAQGSRNVTMRNQWVQLAQYLGFPPDQFPTAPAEVKELFERSLALWESAYWQQNAQQKAKMDAMQQSQSAAMQNPQMSPTRTMPQTPQSQAHQQYLQQLQQQRLSQTPQSQGAPATPSQTNAQLPTANGWATPQNTMEMKQANQFAQHRKSVSRQPDGSPAPLPPTGFPGASPALTNKMIEPVEDQKLVNGADPAVIEDFDLDPTNYTPRSSVLSNQWGGIDPDLLGQLGYHIATFKPNVPDIDEMGIIDIRSLSLQLQSGIHGEVRHALDVLARLTCHPAVNIDLEQCEDLLDIILDCAEEQMEILAEDADEVSDTVDPKSYEETTRQIKMELEGLQPVPEIGSSDWNMDRAADRLLACTSVLRNLSFMPRNTPGLASDQTVKFVSALTRLLGTRELLLRSYVNTQDCMKDLVTLLSNVADQVELPSRDDTNNILHFLLAFAPESSHAGSPSRKHALRFPLYNPRLQRYYPLALDSLAKLLARDEPNRTYLKEVLLDQASSHSDSAPSNQPILQRFATLTRVFGFAIAVLPDRYSLSSGRLPNTNDFIVRVAEARLASLAQGMLTADILASLIPVSEPTLARAWLESEDGWAVSLFRLVTYMCHRTQQHDGELAGSGRRGSAGLMPGRPGRPGGPEEPLNLMAAVNQRAAALLKKLGCKVAESFGATDKSGSADDLAVKSESRSAELLYDVDVVPLSLDADSSSAPGSDPKDSTATLTNGIYDAESTSLEINGATETTSKSADSLDVEYERAKYWSGVAGEILPRAETLFGAFATPTLDLALLRDFVELADLF